MLKCMANLHLRMLTNDIFLYVFIYFLKKIPKVVDIPLRLHNCGNLLILMTLMTDDTVLFTISCMAIYTRIWKF